SVPALFVAIATMPPQPMRRLRPEVDPMLDATVLKALSKAPKDRFNNLSEFASSLAPFGSAEGVASAKRIAVTLARPAEHPATSSAAMPPVATVRVPYPAAPPVARPYPAPSPVAASLPQGQQRAEEVASDDQSTTLKRVEAGHGAAPRMNA